MRATNDPISDMLTRLRNGLAVGLVTVEVPASKLKLQLAKLLKEAGYIAGYTQTKKPWPVLILDTDINKISRPVTSLRRISTPGRRVYVNSTSIPRLFGRNGLIVMSTPQGLMSGHQARKRRLGGEVICEVF